MESGTDEESTKGRQVVLKTSLRGTLLDQLTTEMLETRIIRIPKSQLYCYAFCSLQVEVDGKRLDYPKAEGRQVQKHTGLRQARGLGRTERKKKRDGARGLR